MMFSKNLYFNIILRVLLIVVLSGLLGYFIVIDKSLRFSIICLLIIVFMTVNLISFLNTTNKKIRFFFDSVRNDAVSYTHLRAHETPEHLVCRLLLEKKKKN